ncbi:acyl carrier protein [Pseudomonas sp. REP124]|uniref:acyl carrier protein n=1 Tax=Pseudomonas sp. REP124 TaxID=2875731 RepID=UPI001CCCDF08|nr:acyl carrier protein [Pseudomonas sp. REP124]MBZ9781925.1 acyl carrier protein [Pseudomonas sp. REP124]
MLEIENQVIRVLSDYFKSTRRNITPDSRLIEDLYIDSMSLVELVMALNEFFAIELPEDEVAHWKTVRDICTSIVSCPHIMS